MRVLIVDDKDENLYYLEALLGGNGFEVETAHHGAEALLKARQRLPGLVISDLLMPVMDGYTLLRHWKQDTRLRRVPFIVYTATYTEPEDEQLALNLGADAFILKPSEPDAFMDRVRAAIQKAANEAPIIPHLPVGSEDERLREYSETLIRKLEQKSLELEASNIRLHQDIAARITAETALRETEARFRQLAASIEDVFWLRDPRSSRFLYVSPAFETVFGRPISAIETDPEAWLRSIHPADRERIRESLPSQLAGRWEETYRIIRPDGSERWIRSRVYPVRDAAGQVHRVAGIARDITDYRRLEEQFLQSQKMEAVGRLAGGVAHDFNNLLSVIMSYTGLLLLDLPEGDPTRADVAEIQHASERAADLTRQLLAFSRQQILQPRVLDFGEVVMGTEKMLRRLMSADIVLELHVPRSGSKVYADPSQLEQVVMNLAINARDAMPHGGRLTLEVADVEVDEAGAAMLTGVSPGPYVSLVVTDTGEGMDAGTRERIFEPFFTTKEPGKGTGLGLSTVFGIVQQSQGAISVQSEPGQGARFLIFLPRTDRVLEVVPIKPRSVVSLKGAETILLVANDDKVRETNRTILSRNGYRVIEARSGEDALTLCESGGLGGSCHLLLADVIMPDMSGRTLSERLLPLIPELRVLFVSGHKDEGSSSSDLPQQGQAFLNKPITPESLLQKVRETLDARRS